MFRREFLDRYYPEDVRGKKEIEFLELKQGDMSVIEYAAKFVELAKFYPQYTAETAEFSKCIKKFSELVSSCRIYEEDTKTHYKVQKERKRKQQDCGKPYSAPADKSKQKVNDERRPRESDAPAEVVCYTCGKKGHKSNACTGDVKRCFRCGKKCNAHFRLFLII